MSFSKIAKWTGIATLYYILGIYVIYQTAQKSLAGQASSDVWVAGALVVGGVGGMVRVRKGCSR